VVVKTSIKNKTIMYRAKIQAWIDKVKERYETEKAKKLIES